MKKLVSLILAIMMIAAVGAAFANGDVDGVLTDGKDGMLYTADNEGALDVNSVTIKKQIVVYNTNGEEIYLPNVTYTYTVSAVTPASGSKVTDGDGDEGLVYEGVIAAVTNTDKQATVVYTNTGTANKVTAAAKGSIVEKTFTINFNPGSFTHAGIYRYLITETNDGLDTAGVYRDTTNYSGTTRYLDVYVRRAVTADSASTDYVIYGYVLLNETSSPSAVSASTTTKTNGWMATVDSTTGACTNADIYNTYNLKVTKNITGSLAETNHKFPMSVALTLPSRLTKTVRVYTEGTYGAVTADDESFTTNHTFGDLTTSSHIKLAHEEYVLIVGIPAETTAVVTEINDTYDIYKAEQLSITNGTSTAPAAVNLAAGSVTASQYVITAIDNNSNDYNTNAITAGDVQIVIKNNMEVISPTGYVSRFAPYALILIGGIALLIIAKKRKPKEEEE